MKAISKSIIVLFGAAALISCKEKIHDDSLTTVINVNLDAVKTVIGEHDGSSFPICWKTGDRISVNGVNSGRLEEKSAGKSSASFTIGKPLDKPYHVASPAAAVSGYGNGSASFTIPSNQSHVDGSYDPTAFLMCGTGDINTVSLHPCVGLLCLRISGSASISYIKLTGSPATALSGSFRTDFNTVSPVSVSNSVGLICTSPVALPADFFICVPTGLQGELEVEAYDYAGGSVKKSLTVDSPLEAGQVFVSPTIDYNEVASNITASLKGVTTSSAAFTWTWAGDSAFDISRPYTIALFSDAACQNTVISLDIPAGDSCWNGKQPCFVFGGLDAGTIYYFRVADTEKGTMSDVVPATVKDFTNVAFDAVSNPAAGDVILAENFNEWGYGTDETMGAAGFYDNAAGLKVFSGIVDMDTVSLVNAGNTGRRLFNQTDIWNSGKRIGQWGFAGNSSVYLRAGYLRVTTTASKNRTHIVTPKLAAIPDGKFATVEVTARILRTETDNDFGVLVQTGTMEETTVGTDPYSCYKLTSLSSDDVYPFEMTGEDSWEMHTVKINNVTNTNSLAFGSVANVDTKNRFYLSEISVKLTDLYDKAKSEMKANCSDRSSSTLVFKWQGSGGAADAYTATLYKDAGCTQVDQTFDFPAELGAWNGKQPCFVFGGLNPSTDYWFKVTDTTDGSESDVIMASTEAFTVVAMPSEITSTGVVLAEDFGELRWDYDKCFGAAGYFPSSTSDFSNTGVSSFRKTGDSGEKTLKGQSTALGKSRLNDWVTDSNVYVHPGSLKLGTASARGWILTPEFTVPEGKKAVVNITLTAARHDGSQDNDWAVLAISNAGADPSAHNADFSWPDVENPAFCQTINITDSSVWNTRTVSGLELHHGDRVAFGGRKDGDNKKGRVWISDITVEVISIVDE